MSDLSPWRVEWLRLVRTRRLIALFGAFLFFSFTGPLLAAYLPDLVKRSANSGLKIIAPPPVPADGIQGYADNALLIGLIVLVVVAASACAVDARPALSIFYRTRAGAFWQLLLPRVVVTTCAGVAAYVLGSLIAWYETGVLIGAPDAGAIAESAALVSAYLVFAVAAAAAASTLMHSTSGTAICAIALVLLTQVVSAVPQLTEWTPYGLTGAPNSLVRHTSPFHHYDRALIVCAVAVIGLIAAAVLLGSRREVN